MLKNSLLTFSVILLFTTGYGQVADSTDKFNLIAHPNYDYYRGASFTPDPELLQKYNPRKPLWIPFVETLGYNTFIWSFNRFVADQPHARISWETVKDNFETGWHWDADNLITNMFGHPFGGGIMFNFARTSGYNYWVSLGVTAFGSWQWEFFMENEPPAWNDWIMTTFGGAMYGEMFYRFANLIIDESSSGSERTWREIGAGVMPPNRWLNRLIYGRSTRKLEYQLYEKEPNIGELSIGGNYVAEGTDFKNADKNQVISLEYYYGQLFTKKSYKPMDHFQFYTLLNFGGKQPGLGQFRIFGILWGKQKSYENGSKLLYGLFQASDYLDNTIYEIAGFGVGPGIGYRTPRNKPHAFISLLNVNFMPMGAANSDYAPHYEVEGLDSARTYNMGMGASAKLNMLWLFPIGDLSLNYSFWWVNTMQGAPGNEYVGMWQPKVRFRIIGRWYLGLQYLLYHRIGRYKDYDDVDLHNNEFRAFVGFRF